MSTKLEKRLQVLQADAHAFYLKFHNYHWGVKGINFSFVHKYTEAAYEKMGTLFDDVAERLLQLGGKALVTASDLDKATKAPKTTESCFTVDQVITALLADYEYLLKEFRELNKAAEEAGDIPTANMAQDAIADYEKETWQLRSMVARAC